MSGVARKLLGGVLAISLFVCSSFSVFAYDLVFPQFNDIEILVNGTSVFRDYAWEDISLINRSDKYWTSYTNEDLTGTVDLITSTRMALRIRSVNHDSVVASGLPNGNYSFVFTINADKDLSTIFTGMNQVRYLADGIDRVFTEDQYSVQIMSRRIFGTSNYSNTFILTTFLPSSERNINITLTFGFNDAFSYDGFSYSSSFIVNTPPIDDSTTYPDDLLGIYDITGEAVQTPYGHFDIELEVDEILGWYETFWYYDISNFFSSLFNQLKNSVASYFSSTTSIIYSGFASVRDFFSKQDDDYAAVTDPSTSDEIQEAQGMIDTVEGFESQLHANITTEFDKIDFTTPTNLAAPVAYIGDKVTRSVNALGSGYQPLVFVPLTLGIMLIMLGRGVTALGAFSRSTARSDHRDGLESIRDNPRDERWLM